MKTSTKNLQLVRRQLDLRFSQIPFKFLQIPPEGWIRSIRKSLGMSGVQLAKLLGVNKQSARKYELSEVKGTMTLSTLKKVAEALDARVYVTIIPNRSLEETLRDRARKVAQRLVSRNIRNMDLEGQNPSEDFQKEKIEELTEELIRNMDKRLWDDL